MPQPIQEVLDADEQKSIVDACVPLALEGRAPQEPLPVVEDHMPRIPQTGSDAALRVEVAYRLGEPSNSRAQFLLMTR
jgi:hypothetical protein